MTRLASLCAGFGGLDLAVAAHLPVAHAWHAEIDPDASTVLAAHWPGVPNHGDITAVDWSQVEPVDVLTGGWPCQPFSLAGKRAGADDERYLWPVGVLPAITALRPPLVVMENVPGLLTIDRGRVFGAVLSDLDALGYAVSWTTFGACKVGACHHRHRIYIAATLVDVPAPDGALFGVPLAAAGKWPPAGMVRDGQVWEMPAQACGASSPTLPTPRASDTGTPGRRASEGWRPPLSQVLLDLLPTPTARDAKRGAGWGDQPGRPLSEVAAMLPTPRASDRNGAGGHGDGGPDLRTTVALLPTPTASSYGSNQSQSAGAAVRPSLEGIARMLPTPTAGERRGRHTSPEVAAERLASGRRNLDDAVALLPTPVASDADRQSATYGRGNVTLLGAAQSRFGAYEPAVRRQEAAFGLSAPDPTEPGRLGKPRLAPAFTEWMVGLPAGWITDHVGRGPAIRLAGNGVVPQAAAAALNLLPTFRAALASPTTSHPRMIGEAA